LHRRTLPSGFREIRVELLCDLCTPRYLVRLFQQPHGVWQGEAYLVLSLLSAEPGDTEQLRINREYAVWANDLRRRTSCSRLVESAPPDTDYQYCRICRRIEWQRVFELLEQSGLYGAATDAGYFPAPWLHAGAKRDSIAKTLGQNPGCNDEAGQGI